MGGKSSSNQQQTQTSTTAPWQPAQGALTGILGQLNNQVANSGLTPGMTNAIGQLESNASQGNPYTGQIGNYVNNLFNGYGAQGNLNAYNSALDPIANNTNFGANNPGLQAQLDTLKSDLMQNVNGQFAAAGRDGSGYNQQALARGFAQGAAPIVASQYNQDVQNYMNANAAKYGAGTQTAGLLAGLGGQGVQSSQDALAAQNYAPSTTLGLEQLKQSIPAQNLGLLAQIGVPIAGLGGTTTGTSYGNTQNQMSGAQQFATILGGLRGLWGK